MSLRFGMQDYDKARVVIERMPPKKEEHQTKNNSAPVKTICPQPKGIIFNYKIKKRITNENKPVIVDNRSNKQNVSAIDCDDTQNNVSTINNSNLVPNKMYKVILVDGQLMLAEHDEDYIIEENIEKNNESNAEIIDTDSGKKHKQNNNNNMNVNLKVSTKINPVSASPVILNKLFDKQNEVPTAPIGRQAHGPPDVISDGNTKSLVDKQQEVPTASKNIKSYSLNENSNENLAQKINSHGPNNKMYATLDDLAEAKEGKAMVLLPLEKYTRLRTKLKESQIAEETLKRQENKLKIQINGYQTQQEYLLMEGAKLNKKLKAFEMKEETHLKQLKEFEMKEATHLKKLNDYKSIEQTYLKIIAEKSKIPLMVSAATQTGKYMEKELNELITLRNFNVRMCEVFNEAQIAMMMMYGPKKIKECQWPDVDKEKVIFLRQIISQSAYLFLKNKMNFPLPSSIDLRRWLKERNLPIKSKNKTVKLHKAPANTAYAAQETAQTQEASPIGLQTHDEHITIQPRDEHIHTVQYQNEHIHTVQYQNEHRNSVQNHSVDKETSRAISSIVEQQQIEGIESYDMMSVPAGVGEEFIVYANENYGMDYMQNDNIASTEEIMDTEMNHTEVNDTEMNHTEVNDTEVNQTGMNVHTEVKHKRAKSKPVYLPRCRLCMVCFTSEEQVRDHVPLHYQSNWYTTYLNAMKPYTCEFCNEVVKDKNHLIYHHKGHLGIDPLKCYYSGCTYVGSNTANLVSHQDQHKPATFKCGQCSGLFRTRKYLRSHLARCHSARVARRCPLCRTACKTEFTYQEHMQSHNQPPRIRCRAPDCPERFYSRSQMKQHFGSAHERQFKCPHCPLASFAFNRQLIRHLRLHETQKESHCVRCMMVFHNYTEYYAHLLDHRKFKEKCACGERFSDGEKLAAHKLECTFVAPTKLKKRERKRKLLEGIDFSNINPKRKKYKKKEPAVGINPNIIIEKQEIIKPKIKQKQVVIKPNIKQKQVVIKPNIKQKLVNINKIIIQKQEVIKEANNIEPEASAMSPNLQIVLPDNATPTPPKIIVLTKVDSLPENFRDKLIPLPPNFQQKKKSVALPKENQQELYATAANPEAIVIAHPINSQHNNITLPANPQHNDVTVPTSPQHTDITLSENPQHNDVTVSTNPQHNDVTVSTNPQHNDVTLSENPQHNDVTVSTNPQHNDITVPTSPQHTDITLSENPQHNDVTVSTNPQHNDITVPTSPQHTDITLSENPQHNDVTVSTNPQHNDVTVSTNPQHNDITVPTSPQHTDITLTENPQHTDITLTANPQHIDVTVPTNPQHTDITLPSNPQHCDITLSANQHTNITLPTNPQHTDSTLPTNPQQRVSSLPASAQQKVMGLPANSQQKATALPANPHQRVTAMPANFQQMVTALPANPQQRVIALPANPPHKVSALPANPQQKVTALPAYPVRRVVAAQLANPQQKGTALPANAQQRVIAMPANPHQKVTTLPANSQQRVTVLSANPERRVTGLPANPQRKLITRLANPQQINIAVTNQKDKLISGLDNHQIMKPRSYQPNILASSGSHHRHVPVTPVPEYNLQDQRNAAALQKVKLEPVPKISNVRFSEGNQPKTIVSGTKGYYLNRLSTPHGSGVHKIVTVGTRKKITEDKVLKDMTYVSEFVKTLKTESDEVVPRIDCAVPKPRKVTLPIMKRKKVIVHTPRGIVPEGVKGVPQDVTSENQQVGGLSQRDMPDLEM